MGTSERRDDAERLAADYALLARAGLKRRTAAGEGEFSSALGRLVDAGWAAVDGEAVVLHRPADLPHAQAAPLAAAHAAWLRADDEAETDQVLYGELGYWQHWWNLLHDSLATRGAPLPFDVVVENDPTFTQRPWHRDADTALGRYLVEQNLLSGRVIVPPATLESPAEGLVERAIGIGMEVRVLAVDASFVVYGREAVILSEPAADRTRQRQRLARSSAVVSAMSALFESQWAAAVPWRQHRDGASGVLELLARGWSDDRVAAALGVSARTVSRRVAEAMRAQGARSRFELGVRYARSSGGVPPRPQG